MRKIFAAVLLSLSAFAAQAVTIGFEGLAAGSSPGTAYAEYGVTFTGGSVAYNEEGAYVAGHTTVNFATPISRVTFMADAPTIDSMSSICFSYGCEPFYLGSMSWTPNSPTGRRADWHPGMVWLDDVEYPGITSIGFNTIALDNLSFDLPQTLRAASLETGEVPEPSTYLLLGAGFMILTVLRHYKRNFKVVDQRT